MWFGSWDGQEEGDGGGGPGSGSGSCGIGGWGGPLPGDPSNNSILSATPAFGGIDVNWTYPTTNPFAVSYVKLFRGVTSSFGSALLIAEVGGSHYYDKLETTATFYYWIQIVSSNGTVGETIGPASAAARPLIEDVIEQLTGQIDEGALAIALKNKLDQISLVNANLLEEIMDRETGQTSLAEAIADAQAGIAEAHTFIINETNSRVSANAALVEQIEGVAAAVGTDYGAVIEAMSVDIDALTGTVNAMYTVQLTVNDLVGGFGLTNDGHEVEAGFDVDKFWVGRTSADKRKPFIIVGGETFIDQAVINKLTFSKLTDEAGTFIVADGKVQAAYLNTNGLSVRDSLGNIILNAGSGAFLGDVTGSVGGVGASTLVANANTALAFANAAQDAAEDAQADADNANAAITEMASDSKLSPVEKQGIKKEWDVLVAEKSGLNSQASTFSVTTENTSYNNLYLLLERYLTGTTSLTNAAGTVSAGSNMLASLTTTSDLDKTYASLSAGSALRKLVADFYTARQVLLNKISLNAKAYADAAQATADAAASSASTANAGLTLRLRNDAQNVLSGPGGLATGTLSWNSSGVRTGGHGVGLTQNGLVAYNSAGDVTFTLNGSTGAATFAGTLSAATGSFAGSLTAATGTFAGTLTAAAVNAVNTINIAGNAVSANVTVSGTTATISTNVVVPAGETYQILGIGFQVGTHPDSGGTTPPGVGTLTIARGAGSFSTSIPNVVVKVVPGEADVFYWGYSATTLAGIDILTAGTHTVSLTGVAGLSKTLLILINKR